MNPFPFPVRTAGVFPFTAAAAIFCGGVSAAAPKSVVLSDYFYPLSSEAEWNYVDSKPIEEGVYKAHQVVTLPPAARINVFKIQNGALKDNYKKTIQVRACGGTLRYGTLEINRNKTLWDEFYGTSPRYAIYGVNEPSEGAYVRFSPGAVFPEKIAVGKTVAVTSGMFNAAGQVGPNATFTMKLLGKEEVKVPAGTFPDSIHLRLSVGFKGGPTTTTEEWWAKGVGPVKKKSTGKNGKPIYQNLHSYRAPTFTLRAVDGSYFGIVNIGPAGPEPTKTHAFVVKNTGKKTIKQLKASVSGNTASVPAFIVTQPASGPLAPGETRSFNVTFAPKKASTKPYRVTLEVEAGGNPGNLQVMELEGGANDF